MFMFILVVVAAAVVAAKEKRMKAVAAAKEKRLKANVEAEKQKHMKKPPQLAVNTELQIIHWTGHMEKDDVILETKKFRAMVNALREEFTIARKFNEYTIMLKILTNFFDESLLREENTGLTDKQKLVVLTKLTGFQEKFLTETIDQHPSLKKALLVLIEWYVECEERDQYNTHRMRGADEYFCYKMMLFKSIVPDFGFYLKPRIDKLIDYTREQSILHAKEHGYQ
jgi:hypothetical protein